MNMHRSHAVYLSRVLGTRRKERVWLAWFRRVTTRRLALCFRIELNNAQDGRTEKECLGRRVCWLVHACTRSSFRTQAKWILTG
jgi:hypothetical protein